PNLKDEIPVILAQIKRGERISSYETRRQKKNGEIIHVSLRVSPIKNAEGTIVGASTIARNITELVHAREKARRSEEELRTLNAELEQRVAVRTEELRMAQER